MRYHVILYNNVNNKNKNKIQNKIIINPHSQESCKQVELDILQH